MKKVLIAFGAILIAAILIGYYIYNKPVASTKNTRAEQTVTASELIAAYEAGEEQANASYLGKVIQVKGVVSSITEEHGKKKVILDTGNPMSMVICEMETGTDMADITTGKETSVKGVCSGYLSDVILVQTTVVK
jgi:hypothetical protein